MGILVKLVELFYSKKGASSNEKSTASKGKARKNHITCKMYSVKGKNPDTNRFKTVQAVVSLTETMEKVQLKSGLLPPFEIKEILPDMPTERQIAYAKNINLALPQDATKEDCSIFLSRYENQKPLYPSPMPEKILRYLIAKGIYVPAYAGIDEAHNLYFNNIDLSEQCAYFGMKVYCNIKRKQCCFLEDTNPEELKLFYEFARQYENNNEFVKSLSFYSGNDLPIGSYSISKKLKAYNMALDYFVK